MNDQAVLGQLWWCRVLVYQHCSKVRIIVVGSMVFVPYTYALLTTKSDLVATMYMSNIQCGAVITRTIFSDISRPHSSPVRARYMSVFCGSILWLIFYLSSAIIDAVSYYIGPRYNGTRLYYAHGFVVLDTVVILTGNYLYFVWLCHWWYGHFSIISMSMM